jgi:hypothetical protein
VCANSINSARESRTSAEIELLSSTSADVCELWNGREFVRLAGRPKILSFIYFGDDAGVRLCDLQRAVSQGWMTSASTHPWRRIQDLALQWSSAPNLALNAGRITSGFEKRTFAIIAIAIQSTAVVIPAISAYIWHWNKGSQNAQGYAYPCYLVETLAVCLGVSLCSLVIDHATEEYDLVPTGKRKIGPTIFIQKSCTIGDQEFPDTLIVNNNDNRCTRISRLRPFDKDVRSVQLLFDTKPRRSV